MLSQAELSFLTMVPRELKRIADALEKANDLQQVHLEALGVRFEEDQ